MEECFRSVLYPKEIGLIGKLREYSRKVLVMVPAALDLVFYVKTKLKQKADMF